MFDVDVGAIGRRVLNDAFGFVVLHVYEGGVPSCCLDSGVCNTATQWIIVQYRPFNFIWLVCFSPIYIPVSLTSLSFCAVHAVAVSD